MARTNSKRIKELSHWAAKKADCIKNEAKGLESAVEIEDLAQNIQIEIGSLHYTGKDISNSNAELIKLINKDVYQLMKLINEYNTFQGWDLDKDNSIKFNGFEMMDLYKLIHRTARINEALGYTDIGYIDI
ncbi:MAG: hypothetical protein OQK82_07840 [Candidatus Pacearchaeota archaeon]|nr:hypothetical protein [Candidatus Pacearchaeota archaeon]